MIIDVALSMVSYFLGISGNHYVSQERNMLGAASCCNVANCVKVPQGFHVAPNTFVTA